jgi:GNAT superfamily N-acetyltransferase
MPEPTLRGLRPEDREPIARILRDAGVFRPEEVAVGLELVDESLHPGPTTDYQWLIAERAGRVEGFACFGPVPLTDATFDLYWIAVDPLARGAGIAATLDDAVTEAVRRLAGRWLLAETSSLPAFEPARRFYLKRGYAILSRIPDFYRLGDDRVTFGKHLGRQPSTIDH